MTGQLLPSFFAHVSATSGTLHFLESLHERPTLLKAVAYEGVPAVEEHEIGHFLGHVPEAVAHEALHFYFEGTREGYRLYLVTEARTGQGLFWEHGTLGAFDLEEDGPLPTELMLLTADGEPLTQPPSTGEAVTVQLARDSSLPLTLGTPIDPGYSQPCESAGEALLLELRAVAPATLGLDEALDDA